MRQREVTFESLHQLLIAGTRAREPALPGVFFPAVLWPAALCSPGGPNSVGVVHRPISFCPAFAAVATHLSRGEPGGGRSAVHYRSPPSHAIQRELEFWTTA